MMHIVSRPLDNSISSYCVLHSDAWKIHKTEYWKTQNASKVHTRYTILGETNIYNILALNLAWQINCDIHEVYNLNIIWRDENISSVWSNEETSIKHVFHIWDLSQMLGAWLPPVIFWWDTKASSSPK